MTNDRADWLRIKRLFAQALELPDDQRDAWLQVQCGADAALLAEVRALIEEHSAPALSLLEGDGRPLVVSAQTFDNLQPGARIGAYRLLRLLGQGGMGTVHLAERADGQFTQQVALKLIRGEYATSALLERFRREREILARLAHPNIASLHDGGVGENGAPFFTLEYVEGEPITTWCASHGLSIAARVTLMLKVCEAVQYAHRNLIVHRDLKPSNLLVTADGEPKLLDFGIAKPLDENAQDGLTATHSRPMTREYAAPEQVLGEPITTATDVYAIGVLLYELLCGHLPYASAARGEKSWAKAIVEETPQSLDRAVQRDGKIDNALRRTLRGDLDRVVQRALAKPPEARYASVSALADDLRAWLEHRPVSGSSRRYRLRKFIARHWLPLGAAAAVVLALVAGAVGVIWEARQRAAQAEIALREAATTAAVKDFLIDLFRGADPEQTNGKEISARELVDRGAKRVGEGMQTQPRLRGELESVLGGIYNNLGRNREADTLEQRALDDLNATQGDVRLLAMSELERSRAKRGLDEIDEAAVLSAQATTRLRTLDPVPTRELAIATREQAQAAVAQHRFDAAAPLIEESLTLSHGKDVAPDVLADTLEVAATVAQGRHDLDGSERLMKEEVDLRRATNGDKDPAVATGLADLAGMQMFRGRPRQARENFRTALALASAILDPTDLRLSNIKSEYALILAEYGDFSTAEKLLDEAEAPVKKSAGTDSMAMLSLVSNRALVLFHAGKYAQAEEAYRTEIDQMAKQFGANSPLLDADTMTLAYVRALQGHTEEAAQTLETIATRQTSRRGGATAQMLLFRGNVMRLMGDLSNAETLLRRGLDNMKTAHHDDALSAADFRTMLGEVMVDAKRYADAAPLLREALVIYANAYGESVPASARAELVLAHALVHVQDQHAKAIDAAQRSETGLTTFFGANDARAREAHELLVSLQHTTH